MMIGRAAIGYPWIFREIKHFFATGELLAPPTIPERVDICRKHLRQSVSWKGPVLGILEMRRHYANYLRGLPHIKEFRSQLVTVKTQEEVEDILENIQVRYDGYIPERFVAGFSEGQLESCAY